MANQFHEQSTQPILRDRHQADPGHRYKAFFEGIYDQMTRHEIEPRQSYSTSSKVSLPHRARHPTTILHPNFNQPQ
jgi:hypothetical protein